MDSPEASTSAITLDDAQATSSRLVTHRDYAVTTPGAESARRATLLATRLRSVPAANGKSPILSPSASQQLEAYIHWVGLDPRLDCWVDVACIGEPWPVEPPATPVKEEEPPTSETANGEDGQPVQPKRKKRSRESESPVHVLSSTGVAAPNTPSQPRLITTVIFGQHEITTWYDSPYQLEEVTTNIANPALHLRSISGEGRSASLPLSRSLPSNPRKRPRPTSRAHSPAVEHFVPSPRANHSNLSQLPPDARGNYQASPPPKARVAAQEITLHANNPAMDVEMIRTLRSNPAAMLSVSLPAPPKRPMSPLAPPPKVAVSVSTEAQPQSNGDVTPPTASSASPTDEKPAPALMPVVVIPSAKPIKQPRRSDAPKPGAGQKRGPGGRFARKEGPLKRPKSRNEGANFQKELRDLASFSEAFSPGSSDPSSPPVLRNGSVVNGSKELQLVPSTGLSSLKDGRLYVCDGCFKYMTDMATYEAHHRDCKQHFPPGRKIWQRGSQTIWEVDGAKAKLWCQNLCLFGKLFIDHKYVFFDVDGFLFYVLCEGDGLRDYMVGFFSKEKISYDDYNLACIVTLPPHQKKGYGFLLIELSYELHRRTKRFQEKGIAGTPERPLSDLGLRGYLAFWTSVLIRYFRRLFEVRSVEAVQRMQEEQYAAAAQRQIKKSKGWVGVITAPKADAEPIVAAEPAAENGVVENGETEVAIRVTIEQIAANTGLRDDDVILALKSCGLMQYIESKGAEQAQEEESSSNAETVLVITPESIEKVTEERNVKPALLELACMLPFEPVE